MARPELAQLSIPHLGVSLQLAVGTLQIDVNFRTTEPWTILFGPSGSGKTTILRAIAGLIRPSSAKITASYSDHDGQKRTVTMIDTEAGSFVPSHLRSVALSAQRTSLFPHRTVRQQIVYGMAGSKDAATIRQKTDEVLGLFRIAALADKYPAALSGGEAQRVQLARTAASATGFLLLDEPFNGLELNLRSEIMDDLRVWAAERKICVLSVTHDVAEAFLLEAEVIKLAEGKVVAQGPVDVVLAEERTRLLQQLGGERLPERSSEPYLGG